MLDLLDWRRRVSVLYAAVRASDDPIAAHQQWRATRDTLFLSHTQSPLDAAQKQAFKGLPYYDYNAAFRIVADVQYDVEPQTFHVDLGDDGKFAYRRIGRVQVDLPTGSGTLSLFWIEGYGGGLFLPFKDATNKETTYGAGRYLYDSIKSADLGTRDGKLILDFNFAYHPSCAYNPRWTCPLAPRENTLDFAVTAGEKLMPE